MFATWCGLFLLMHNKLATRMAVNFPPTYLHYPGKPAVPFGIWTRMFENYLLAIHAKGVDWPDHHKRVTLLHCLETEAQRIFYNLPNTGTTYASALKALKASLRHKFRQREQMHDENILQYVAALRGMVSLCMFGDKEDEMIRNQVVQKVYSIRICERLVLYKLHCKWKMSWLMRVNLQNRPTYQFNGCT